MGLNGVKNVITFLCIAISLVPRPCGPGYEANCMHTRSHARLPTHHHMYITHFAIWFELSDRRAVTRKVAQDIRPSLSYVRGTNPLTTHSSQMIVKIFPLVQQRQDAIAKSGVSAMAHVQTAGRALGNHGNSWVFTEFVKSSGRVSEEVCHTPTHPASSGQLTVRLHAQRSVRTTVVPC